MLTLGAGVPKIYRGTGPLQRLTQVNLDGHLIDSLSHRFFNSLHTPAADGVSHLQPSTHKNALSLYCLERDMALVQPTRLNQCIYQCGAVLAGATLPKNWHPNPFWYPYRSQILSRI